MLAAIQQTGICIDSGPHDGWYIQPHCFLSQANDNTENGLHFIAAESKVTQGTYLTSVGFIQYVYLTISRLLCRGSAVQHSYLTSRGWRISITLKFHPFWWEELYTFISKHIWICPSCVIFSSQSNSRFSIPIRIYSAVPLKRGHFSPTSTHKTPHISPSRSSYWVSVVILVSDSLSATVIAVSYVTSWWVSVITALDCIYFTSIVPLCYVSSAFLFKILLN